ncbi:MAG: DNA primase [Clostridia bacterium]|nr:DNA primase [Clostridia bacterium]
MPRYSDQLISEVIGENDIVDYISQYVRLKQSGRDYTGLCPFHKEKSPSFHVNRDKQVFHCFGCGAGGGLMQFVMRIEGLDFVESLKLLADRAGIILPEDGDIAKDDAKYRQKQRIYEINKLAARFFYDTLTKTPEGKAGLEYFYNRKILPQTITKYGLGYAPDKYDALLGYLRSKGYSDQELLDAQVIGQKNGKIYDFFRGRVIFPIIDLRGNVIGFGGRVLTDAKPKYLNTTSSPVFDKGRSLFSLNLAKKTNDGKLILCEGYMDVISVYQAGITNVVATLGTALTENQAKLLLKYCNEILICYDSDDAGQAATRRAIDIINSVGGKARVVEMHGAKDPDEYIKINGVEMFRSLVNNAPTSSDYLIKNARRSFNLDTEEGKIGYVSSAVDSLKGVRDDIEVDAYIKRISKESGISVDAIYAEHKKKAVEYKKEKDQISRPPVISVVATHKRNSSKLEETEILLLSLCTKSKKLYKVISNEVKANDYSTPTLIKLAGYIYTAFENGAEPDSSRIINMLDDDEVPVASKVFCLNEQYSNAENAALELVKTIKREKIEQQLEGETNPAKIVELIKQRDKLGRNM